MPVTIALASAETLDGQTARNASVMLDAMAEASAHGRTCSALARASSRASTR